MGLNGKPMNRSAACAAALLAVLVMSCSADTGDNEDVTATEDGVGEIDQAIVNGTIFDPNYSGIVELMRWTDGSTFCTGTLITNTWVVTAKHCIENTDFFLSMGNQILFPHHQLKLLHPNASEDVALVGLTARAKMLAFNGVPTDRGYLRPLNKTALQSLVGTSVLCAGYGPGGVNPLARHATLRVGNGGGTQPLCFLPNASGQLQEPTDSGGGCFSGPSLPLSPIMYVQSFCAPGLCCGDPGGEWVPWVEAVLAFLGTGS